MSGDTILKLKGKRGFLSDESSLNKLSWQRTSLGRGQRIGYSNHVKLKLWYTNIAIQPYQSYRTRAHRTAIRTLHEAIKTHTV